MKLFSGWWPWRKPKPSTGTYVVPPVTVEQELPAAADAAAGRVPNQHGLFVRGEDGVTKFVPPPAVGPGHPEWPGRAKIPFVTNGWADPGHPMQIYQQHLKYMNSETGFPAGWKVIGWTPEGVSYLVPEAHWTPEERAAAWTTVRDQSPPGDWVGAPALVLPADRSRETSVPDVNAAVAALLDRVRALTERHARLKYANGDRAVPAELSPEELEAWAAACGRRAVDKRLADVAKIIGRNGLLDAVPTDDHIYAALGAVPTYDPRSDSRI